jgi:hypothetical protein
VQRIQEWQDHGGSAAPQDHPEEKPQSRGDTHGGQRMTKH